MAEYHVQIPKLYYQTYKVEADSPRQAVAKILLDGQGDKVGKARFDMTFEDWDLWVKNMDNGEEWRVEDGLDVDSEED